MEHIIHDMYAYNEKYRKQSKSNHIAYLISPTNKKNINVHAINQPFPRYNNKKISRHAEMEALRKLSRKMILYHQKKMNVNMYIIRIDENGMLQNSRPCKHCCIEMFKHKKIRINKLYFSNDQGEIECHNFIEWDRKTEHHITYGWKFAR